MIRLKRFRDIPVGVWSAVGLTVAATVWMAALLAAPGALGHSGSLPAVFVYEIGALICHQRPERSFHLAGVQMPVCARCVGLYASATLGALIAWTGAAPKSAALLHPRARLMFILVAAPTVVSAAAEWLALLHPSGVARALLGVPLGAYLGWAFVRSLRAQTFASGPAAEMRYHS